MKICVSNLFRIKPQFLHYISTTIPAILSKVYPSAFWRYFRSIALEALNREPFQHPASRFSIPLTIIWCKVPGASNRACLGIVISILGD